MNNQYVAYTLTYHTNLWSSVHQVTVLEHLDYGVWQFLRHIPARQTTIKLSNHHICWSHTYFLSAKASSSSHQSLTLMIINDWSMIYYILPLGKKYINTYMAQALRQTRMVAIVSGGSWEDLGSMSSFPPSSWGHLRWRNFTQADMNGSPCSRILSVNHLSNFKNSPAKNSSIN